MREFIGMAIAYVSIALGIYVGGWIMFIKPIINLIHMFDAGTLTGAIIGITIFKCLFSGTVGALIAYVGSAIGIVIAAK